jgi:hypothetical protein
LKEYRTLAKATAADPKAQEALHAFEPGFVNDTVLALDRPFVHRLRMVTGKDTNPLNEVELIAESLIHHGGAFTTNNVIKYVSDASVVGLKDGDPIQLSPDDFERLSIAFFRDLERKFVAKV